VTGVRIELTDHDITTLEVDAIVNAANCALSGGGGVDGAIHRAAGPELKEECRRLGRCPTGEAVITQAYRLSARYVIHAVGPVWEGGGRNERELLARCYRRSLELAKAHDVKSIAFPAISCGAYRFPVREAARVAFGAVTAFLESHESPRQVLFVCFDKAAKRAYEQLLAGHT
jgi:O-acetyl-ADP-ribose deacetylase (regulator of RNase III)